MRDFRKRTRGQGRLHLLVEIPPGKRFLHDFDSGVLLFECSDDLVHHRFGLRIRLRVPDRYDFLSCGWCDHSDSHCKRKRRSRNESHQLVSSHIHPPGFARPKPPIHKVGTVTDFQPLLFSVILLLFQVTSELPPPMVDLARRYIGEHHEHVVGADIAKRTGRFDEIRTTEIPAIFRFFSRR